MPILAVIILYTIIYLYASYRYRRRLAIRDHHSAGHYRCNWPKKTRANGRSNRGLL